MLTKVDCLCAGDHTGGGGAAVRALPEHPRHPLHHWGTTYQRPTLNTTSLKLNNLCQKVS